jgi:hypothetical protein
VYRKYIPIYVYPTRCNVTQFIYIWKLLYTFRVVLSPITRSAYNCIYSIWYLSHRYCCLPLSWKSWNRFECAVGGVRLGAFVHFEEVRDNSFRFSIRMESLHSYCSTPNALSMTYQHDAVCFSFQWNEVVSLLCALIMFV